MREIKFRAWDADMGMMIFPKKHYAPKYASGHLSEFYNPEENEFHIAYDEDERFTLMQFTGLKDKNGKEIYEGDMLFNPAGGSIVSFHSGRFVVGDFGVDLYRFAGENKEVIGNIYETPELLTNN